MLKGALCINIGIFGLLSLLLCINSFSKKSIINWISVAVVLLVLTFINLILASNCVDLDWGLLLAYLCFIITEILLIITIIKCFISRKNRNESPSIIAAVAMIAVPVALFAITYSYELYRINACDYLVQYNYQNGIVESKDTFLAIKNHKPAKVTLIKNLFNRKITKEYKGIATDLFCSIDFDDNGNRKLNIYNDYSKEYEAVFDKIGEAVYADIPGISYIEIHYVAEENDAHVRTMGSEYIYHDYEKTAQYDALGNIMQITVY